MPCLPHPVGIPSCPRGATQQRALPPSCQSQRRGTAGTDATGRVSVAGLGGTPCRVFTLGVVAGFGHTQCCSVLILHSGSFWQAQGAPRVLGKDPGWLCARHTHTLRCCHSVFLHPGPRAHSNTSPSVGHDLLHEQGMVSAQGRPLGVFWGAGVAW